jgi:5-methylcytosine-specific restriction endonuclease McrA
MNYLKHYNTLVDRAKGRVLEGYSERHHIIPKCIGGNNKKDNLVRLTPEEHYVAHQLLVKIYPGNHKLLFAAFAISSMNNRGFREYAWLKRKRAAYLSSRPGTMTGKKHTDEAKQKMKQNHWSQTGSFDASKPKGKDSPNYGKQHSQETLQKLKIPKTLEWRTKMSGEGNPNYGKHFSDESKQKMRERAINRPKPTCPYCGTIAMGKMIRYHYENCKSLVRAA